MSDWKVREFEADVSASICNGEVSAIVDFFEYDDKDPYIFMWREGVRSLSVDGEASTYIYNELCNLNIRGEIYVEPIYTLGEIPDEPKPRPSLRLIK
ncbi:MAG: hypothetical protein ACPHUL_00125 [Marinomonas gallaica]